MAEREDGASVEIVSAVALLTAVIDQATLVTAEHARLLGGGTTDGTF